MIARKITYRGNMNRDALTIMFDITRKTEITGQVKAVSDSEIELNLEGDASMIQLIQFRIERDAKAFIKEKNIIPMTYQYYVGVTLIN